MKNLTGYVLVFACVMVVSTACNDDESPGEKQVITPDLFLRKIVKNGSTLFEFILDSEKKLIRLNSYNAVGGLSTYTLFEYDESGIREFRRYSGTLHSLMYRSVFTHDNTGRVSKADHYSTIIGDNVLHTVSTYTYDAAGRITKRETGEPSEQPHSADEFIYSANQLIWQRISNPEQDDEYIAEMKEYVSGNQSATNQWNNFSFLLYASGNYEYFLEMYEFSHRGRFWWSNGSLVLDTWTTAVDREYTGDYLTKQTLIQENLLENEPDEI
ncbi:MAG TPA: hypothetical protein VGK39_03255, partial [Cyclobacteriaceae bacterium]